MAEDANAVNQPVTADVTPPTSATGDVPASQETSEAEAVDFFQKGFSGDVDTGETETEKDTTDVVTEEQAQEETPDMDKKSDDPKEDWDSLSGKSQDRFRKMNNELKEARERLAQLEARKSQVAQEQELLDTINPETGEYFTPAEAERIARYSANEKLQKELATEQARADLLADVMDAAQKYPCFDTNSQDFDESISKIADPIVAGLLRTEKDANGQDVIVGYHVKPSVIYQAIYEAAQLASKRSEIAGKLEGKKAMATMLSNAEPTSSVGNAKSSQKDAFLEGFNSAS